MKKTLTGLAAALIAVTGAASATTITFEGITNKNNFLVPQPFTIDGYVFENAVGDLSHFHISDSTFSNLQDNLVNNGTYVLMNDRPTDLVVTAANGGKFKLVSFDAAASSETNGFVDAATSVVVEAFLDGFSVGSASININTTSYVTLIQSFGTIDQLVFSGVGGGENFALDNIQFAPIPLPAAGVMMVTGLAGLAAARRRRRKTA